MRIDLFDCLQMPSECKFECGFESEMKFAYNKLLQPRCFHLGKVFPLSVLTLLKGFPLCLGISLSVFTYLRGNKWEQQNCSVPTKCVHSV